MKYLTYLFYLIFFVLIACEELEQAEVSFVDSFPSSIGEGNTYLRGFDKKVWGMEQFTLQGYGGFQDCRLDDKITLNSDGTYTYDGGSVLCGAEDNETTKFGTWTLDYEMRKVLIDGGTDSEFSLYIESLTDDIVVFSSRYIGLQVLGKLTRKTSGGNE